VSKAAALQHLLGLYTGPIGTLGTLVLLLQQISYRVGPCTACIMLQADSLSFAFHPLAIWSASLFFKNIFIISLLSLATSAYSLKPHL